MRFGNCGTTRVQPSRLSKRRFINKKNMCKNEGNEKKTKGKYIQFALTGTLPHSVISYTLI